MPSKQVKEILDHVRSVHQKLKKVCHQLGSQETDPRMKLLFEYIERHEEAFNTSVRRFEKDAGGHGLLETWLQFTSDEFIDEDFKELELTSEMSAEEIVENVLAFDTKLVAIYRDLADSTSSSQLKELFNDLVQFEEDKERQYAKMMQDW
ncbi:hypothetical protein LOC68_10850 [Blastopirellula sp. JC732]|uniref:DUF2383 domain-containing protein n=1 Tax=Blastopirellula sediminis TaxID=2894196 RepID=A0A9X1MKM6_9BACT|nr:hypothetical protein [Blastopirellula sediminis]MCC9608325.1 hypothetical protein [Blastopirellula sediminis]MCC9628898.1 hypothetical protein [Blastopirellula sediminis]